MLADGAAGRRYVLSLYFVDFGPTPWGDGQTEDANRTQEVYLLALPGLTPVAPRAALRDFSGGLWLSFDVAGSVRVRVTTMRGDYAVVSALAFDEAQQ